MSRIIKNIRNAHYLENGAIDCEVLYEGEQDHVLYTAIRNDTAPTGRQIWQELQSGRWGKIIPFTVTPEIIAEAKDARMREIGAWRDVQEEGEFTFEWNGHNWDGGKASQSRLLPVVAAAGAGTLPEGFFWTDADNHDVRLTPAELAGLDAAMTTAMVMRGFRIHERQRRMKEEVRELQTLDEIRAYRVGWLTDVRLRG
ncbi:DUF4376 domain-containing protein [Escherichia coli]|nr:DUF4376 domain-containing protein [Escherichia coli]